MLREKWNKKKATTTRDLWIKRAENPTVRKINNKQIVHNAKCFDFLKTIEFEFRMASGIITKRHQNYTMYNTWPNTISIKSESSLAFYIFHHVRMNFFRFVFCSVVVVVVVASSFFQFFFCSAYGYDYAPCESQSPFTLNTEFRNQKKNKQQQNNRMHFIHL